MTPDHCPDCLQSLHQAPVPMAMHGQRPVWCAYCEDAHTHPCGSCGRVVSITNGPDGWPQTRCPCGRTTTHREIMPHA